MKQVIKETTGGKVSRGKTKPMPSDLGISNNSWGNKMTKEEKAVVKAAEVAAKAKK
jgi:hypothetical protein